MSKRYWYYHPGKNEWIDCSKADISLIRKAGFLVAEGKGNA